MAVRKSRLITRSLRALMDKKPDLLYSERPRWCDAWVYPGASVGPRTPYLENQIAAVAGLQEKCRKDIWWTVHYDMNEGPRLYFWAGTEQEVLVRLHKAGSPLSPYRRR